MKLLHYAVLGSKQQIDTFSWYKLTHFCYTICISNHPTRQLMWKIRWLIVYQNKQMLVAAQVCISASSGELIWATVKAWPSKNNLFKWIDPDNNQPVLPHFCVEFTEHYVHTTQEAHIFQSMKGLAFRLCLYVYYSEFAISCHHIMKIHRHFRLGSWRMAPALPLLGLGLKYVK